MPKPTDYDKTHLRNMAAIGTRIDRIFKKAAEEAAKIGMSIKTTLPEDRIFSFDDYPATKKQIERLMTALQQSMETTIVNGVRSAWTLSNNKNNDLVSRIFGERAKSLSKEEYRRYFSTNGAALEAFLQRQAQGLNLSDRVWRYTSAFKREIELGLDLGIRTGESAVQMSRSLRQYLQYPDKLFRRVRDKHGVLKLSKAAKEFHPGQGVYRSSYKNARRLACTETNIAYRTSDHLRWQQMDFVVGIEVRLSNNHTLNGIPLTDICDKLKGRYPKDFKFTGWHPQCRCHAVPVLKTEEEMAQDTQRILAGEEPVKGSVNAVRAVPAAFKDWIEDNADRIERAANRGTMPYFIRDNQNVVDKILGMGDNPAFAIRVKVGEKEYLLKDLIAECRVEPTEKGKIYVHPDHGKNELSENLDFARWRAEMFGEEVVLLPNPQGAKRADSYNITRGVQEEYKRSQSPSVSSIDFLIRSGAKQADHLVLEPIVMNIDDLSKAVHSRVRRTDVKEIRLRIGDFEAVYTRDAILKPGFKIKPEDFLNESISRSWGARNNPISDANIQNFFGLNKKTPQEIAIERHAKRDAAKIQQLWNERKIANIKKAVDNRLLPKEVINGLSALPQKEFNARINYLQKTAARHVARTPADIDRIKEAWAQKQLRDKTIRQRAENILAEAKEWAEVDYSVLEKLISGNDLTKMRDESMNVIKAIKAIRDEEKALADLIPDAHGWHKTFSLSELKEAHGKIQSTLDYWKAKGYDLATDSKLSILKTELEQKIKFVENPGAFKAGLKAHKTWQVQQKAYQELLNKVETRIEIISLESEYQSLLNFKTTSKEFNEYMAKAKAAIDTGNVKNAKGYLTTIKIKKKTLERGRKGKNAASSATIAFGEMSKEKIEKLLIDFHTNTVGGVDKELRTWMEGEWNNLTWDEKRLLTRYTQAYTYLNDRLRGLPPKSWIPQKEYDHDMPIITAALDKLKAPRDMVVRRGTNNYRIKELGKDLADLNEGDVFTEPAFLSTAAHRDKGFFMSYEMVIVVPKGARGAFAEPFSHYNDSCKAYDYDYDRIWDGKTKQSIEEEFEWIEQRGCQFKVLKRDGNRIIMQLIGQLR